MNITYKETFTTTRCLVETEVGEFIVTHSTDYMDPFMNDWIVEDEDGEQVNDQFAYDIIQFVKNSK